MSLSRDLAATLERLQAEGAQAVGLAISGGGDSMALLDLAEAPARALGLRLEAATVDHRLRSEAADEARMVAGHCAARDIRHEVLVWQHDGAPAGNIQAEARAARYGLLATWAARRGLSAVLLAHNLEDLAETFLIRLGRAAGLDGLSAMAPEVTRHGMRFVRPLLSVSRGDLRAHLQARGIAWAEDPSNSDPHYTRVKVRAALSALAGAGISVSAITRSARMLGESRGFIERLLLRDWQQLVRLEGGDLVIAALPEDDEAARRLLNAALREVGGQAYAPRHTALEDLRLRLRHQKRHTLSGCLITREGAGLRVAREERVAAGLRAAPGDWWDGRWRLSGPDLPGACVTALGPGILQIKGWREHTNLPRASLMAGPALWCEGRLIAAPLARPEPQWQLELRKGFGTLPFVH